MAASYFGKFDSQAQAQQALDQGKLYKPFVAMWEDTVHYDDLDEIAEGSLSTNELTGMTSAQTQKYVEVYAGSLYWFAESSENWITFDGDHNEGYGDDGFTLNIDSNDVTESRYAEIRVTFYYDDQYEVVRNVQTVSVEQEAGKAPSTGATVTLSNSELDANGSWQYLQVSDSDGLYWMATPPEWINQGNAHYSGGDGAWWFEVGYNPVNDRDGDFTVDFFEDAQYSELLFTETVSISQQGEGGYAPSFDPVYFVENVTMASGTGQTEVFILNNSDYYWKVYGAAGEQGEGGPSDTAITVYYDMNTQYNPQDKSFQFNFYDDSEFNNLVDQQWLSYTQEGNPDALFAEWRNGGNFLSRGGSDIFDIQFDNQNVAYYALNLMQGAGHFGGGNTGPCYLTASTSDVATGVTFTAHENTASTPVYGSIRITALNAQYQALDIYDLEFYVAEVQPEVIVVGTFITTSDNESVAVPSYNGGDWTNAYIDGDPTDVLPKYDATYTFPSAGTHTITYVRECSDTYLQGWFMNSDVVSVSGTSTTEWGCHGNNYYQSSISMTFAGNTQLTGATFDTYMNRIGSSCFSGCTSLVYLAFNNPNGVDMIGVVYPFDTITANTGTVHIPSGKQSEYANVITALGNNWTVVDDL